MVVIALIVGAIESPYFLDFRYLIDSSSLYVETGFLALGMTLVIVSGAIDLSVASMMVLCATTFAIVSNKPFPPIFAIACSLVVGIVLGGLNGLMVTRLKLPSFIVTLGTMAVYRGLAQVILKGESQPVYKSLIGSDMVSYFGLPLPLLVFIFVALVTALVLHKTVLGRWIVAHGLNRKTATYSGIPVDRVTTLAFAASGLMAGIAGVFIASRLGIARYDHATGLEVDVITAVVLGGASIYGGSGSVLGTCIAMLLLALVRIGLGLANVTAEYQLAAVGTLLIVAVLATNGLAALSKRKPVTKA
ncbi:ABC transporter permease [soil metagenome]